MTPAPTVAAHDEAPMPDAADLAIQLYTVRRPLADDVDATLAELAAIGFRTVEPYDLVTFRERLAAGLPRHGLVALTAHAPLLGDDLDEVLAAAVQLGVETVIQPWTEPARWQTPDGIADIAGALNAAAERAADDGIRIGYHNHHFELATRIGGRHALEVLADRLEPEVVLEVDAYWAYAGGADVPALLQRLGDRVVALHVKDGDGSLDPLGQVAVGAGVVPIRAILAAAPAALRVVELDDTSGDILAAVRASHAFLTEIGRADG
jgi:sugar phosphate isomerase/epimerase